MPESKSSGYLEEVLFREQSSAANRLFEQKSELLFEEAANGSFVEICVQEPHRPDLKNSLKYKSPNVRDEPYLSDIDFSCQGISPPESPSPVESVKLILNKSHPQNPPRYIGENGIYLYTVSEPLNLGRIAAESQDGFRICFIRQRHPNSRLLMSRALFETLLVTFDIFPRFKEFVLFFGLEQKETGMGPPQLRFRTTTTDGRDCGPRRNVGFECAYELRYVEPNVHYVKKPWRLRQTAVYHRFRVENLSSTWVVVSASSNTESSIDRYIKSSGDLTAPSPFEIHLLIVENALSNWRPYVIHRTEKIVEQSQRALAAFREDRDPPHTQDMQERHILKDTEEELLDVLLVLDSLHETVDSLLENYTECVRSSGQLYDGDHDTISRAFQAQMKEISFSHKNVQSLRTKVQGTNALLLGLVELRNSVSLKQIAEDGRSESANLRRWMEKGTHDSSPAVKVVLAVIALVYLPTAVVYSFFSTEFVTMQLVGQHNELVVASNAWLLTKISAPLTALTLILWYAWGRVNIYKRKPKWASRVAIRMSNL